MSEAPKINLYNINNLDPNPAYDKQYNFVYADCMYESTDFTWLCNAISSVKVNGIFIIQTDYHTQADYIVAMREFNEFTLLNHLIYLNDWGGVPRNRFAQKHDDILVYVRGVSWKWYPERIQILKATAGTAFDKKGTGTKTPPSVFYDHASFSTMSGERVRVDDSSFPFQKPLWLLRRIMYPFLDTGDSVLDLFMGTGTCGCVAKEMGCNYTGIEYITSTFNVARERINGHAEKAIYIQNNK
jgi:hypothetical protein